MGNGAGFLDYNVDDSLDILLVGRQLALYQGDGKGHFTDVTKDMGLGTLAADFRGCAVGDYDNDGYPDIYISAVHGGVLLHNDHGARFVDVSPNSGIAAQPWGTSCAFVDVDNDGLLDLFIGNYVKFDPKRDRILCPSNDVMTACGPNHYEALHGVLYRNVGGGRFADFTRRWGVDKTSGKALGVATADFDGSGHQGVALANDEMAGDLLKNSGHGFTNIGASSGTAYDASAAKHAGMGIDWGDFDNDGQLDLAVTTYQFEPKSVYHNDGAGLFSEQSSVLGVGNETRASLAFGIKWIDFDNDGFLDLMIANGHVEDNAHQVDARANYRQSVQLLRNENGRHFTDISSSLVRGALKPIVGRGLAIGDYDNDGRVDALVVDSEGTPLLLHNETKTAGNWLEVTLMGTKSNRDGQGAIVTVETSEHATLMRQCSTSGSYLSASDRRVHFGLGKTNSVMVLTVKWPDGHVDTYHGISVNKMETIKEGQTSIVP